jgi:hypothetical protein
MAVKKLMEEDKNISVKEICAKTNLKPAQVYAIRNYLKTFNKVRRVVYKKSNGKNAKSVATREVDENMNEMYRIAHYWKQAYHELEEKTRNHVAVIQYLESKVHQLLPK